MTIRFDLGAKPHLGYTGSVVERAADLRQDPIAIAMLEADARARTFVICGEFVIVRKEAPLQRSDVSLRRGRHICAGTGAGISRP